jgi:hypothetical protein
LLLFIWLKSPAAISADIVPFSPAKSVVFAGCAREAVGGDFSGHRSFSAGKKRGFCRLCPRSRWRRFQRTSFLFRRQKAWFLPAGAARRLGRFRPA